jgi:hypothetical protein
VGSVRQDSVSEHSAEGQVGGILLQLQGQQSADVGGPRRLSDIDAEPPSYGGYGGSMLAHQSSAPAYSLPEQHQTYARHGEAAYGDLMVRMGSGWPLVAPRGLGRQTCWGCWDVHLPLFVGPRPICMQGTQPAQALSGWQH